MIGRPKYKVGDTVNFKADGKQKTGKIEIVDEYGTFGDNSDVSYDIFIEEENTLYKHFSEKFVYEPDRSI